MFSIEPEKIVYIRDKSRLYDVIPEILSYDIKGWDTETTGLKPEEGDRIRLSTFALPNGTVYVLDCFHLGWDFHYDLFPGPGMTAVQNGKFDAQFLMCQLGIKTFGFLYDTMLAAQLCAEGDIEWGFGLDDLMLRYFDIEADKSYQKSNWSKPELSSGQIRYAGLDAWYNLLLYEETVKGIKETGQVRTSRIEFDAVPAVAEMEINGFKLDGPKWLEQFEITKKESLALKEDLWAFLGDDVPTLFEGIPTLNLDSQQQVVDAFLRKDIQLPINDKTGNYTLNKNKIKHIKSKHGKMYADYKVLAKKMSSYGPNWLKFISELTGRIHQSYKQIGAETGRFSCHTPNLQQIPQDDRYRNCFVADDGWVLVADDYSQVELRLAAEYSRDENLLKAFDSGQDLHQYTASLLWKIPYDEVTKALRSIAKNQNFRVLYGGGPYGLSEAVDIPYDEAKHIIHLYMNETYTGLRDWLNRQARNTINQMRAETLSGRKRRYIGDIRDEKTRSEIERNGKNLPIQGTSADISKRAAHLYYERIKYNPDIKMCHIVHDELISRARPWAVEECQHHKYEAMMQAEQEFIHRCKSKVDSTVTFEWSKEPSKEQLKAAQDYVNSYKLKWV